jgi:uncharacterized membrane protein
VTSQHWNVKQVTSIILKPVQGAAAMAKFFGNLNAVLAAGFAALLVIYFALAPNPQVPAYAVLTFLHVLVSIMWIGLLYYFNFVQIPTMPTVPADLKPGVTKYIAPKALFWFRWAALATVVFGLAVAGHKHYLVEALTLQSGMRVIGVGMWLGMIMAFNVWVFIWPNQKIALGIVNAEADAKAKAATTAMMFSRTNCLLSIPMLYCMVVHGLGGAA